ncbi:MAG: efflux RND transporter periplasmic adaptor subunit [Hyphomicrobiales bacterium]|nr:efflux RND transporter periplasmic adaptor subunit [Hyphomicrobiales bacterium]MDE2016847.1 efflux RND transporter periplasmic adaptor subunit [Hyphomicrobiales bacterium]
MAVRAKSVILVAAALAVAYFTYAPDRLDRVVAGGGAPFRALRGIVPAGALAAVDRVMPSALKAGPVVATAPAAAVKPALPAVSVAVDTAKRGPLELRIDTVGTVQTVATVQVRSRVDGMIDKVFVKNGDHVEAGQPMFSLDKRNVEAQDAAAKAQILKDQATLEQANRDLARYQNLVKSSATPVLNLENAKTAVATATAAIAVDQAAIKGIETQLSWYDIAAPLTGRIGAVGLTVGNLARASDNSAAGVLATINQTSPIYVQFPAPQQDLGLVRAAMAAGQPVYVTPQGGTERVAGAYGFVDNSVDSGTGTVAVRATFANADEKLWPGQLCDVRAVLRVDPDVVTVPRTAVQVSQDGNFVFVVKDGVARVVKVTVSRSQDAVAAISSGLAGGETVVVDGALLLRDGSKVTTRPAAGAKS